MQDNLSLSSKGKSVFLYLLAAIIMLMLYNARKCVATVPEPVPKPEIVYRYIPEYHTVVKVVIRKVTIRDTVTISKDRFVLKDTLIYRDGETIIKYPDSMRVYEGQAQGGRCTYNYMTGVFHDSIQFLDIRTECQQDEPVVIVRPGGPPKFEWGITTAWTSEHPRSFPGLGLHARRKNWYLGADYFPREGTTILRAGVFLTHK